MNRVADVFFLKGSLLTSLVTLAQEGKLFGHAHGALLSGLHLQVASIGAIRPDIVVACHVLTPSIMDDATIATPLIFSHSRFLSIDA